MSDDKRLIKLQFLLANDSWHGSATESLWAEDLNDGRYQLRNTPFFAFGVSAEDIVSARASADLLEFKAVVSRGGHSTYRIIVDHDRRDQFDTFWAPLSASGCTFEQGRVLAVDVPPEADIYKVYSHLEEGEKSGVWDFEEGHCGHLTKE